ncbi:ribosome small subunit-dependent GTPase A [Clostridium oryzae]|uniref:Small ribosomal subunit biogenesis GTPase RsgA n=1 Tax=Clostridium oryzae TaxID=1450648 RepID=A0A1V4IEA6_9CLOT|nr:ribosome small subunit-dependent GTPase A [Clostridium oryzae]OPJ58266.1 putative ribosome biogenesis GTPase RsgA [Clostridium oryzae]
MINNMESYGYNEFYKKQVNSMGSSSEKLMAARIIEAHREQYKIMTKFGERTALLKGSKFYNEAAYADYPVIGDFVLVNYNPSGSDVIYEVLKRKSKFSRIDSFNGIEQILASNFDYVFIMTSLNYDLNAKRIDRYLTMAWESGGIPIIVLTKADLCEDVAAVRDSLRHTILDVPIIAVSSHTGEGIEELKQYIKPKTTVVFLGSSGVGKSSLVNAVAGEEIMKVSEIREDDSKGRHTTTHRQLIMMNNGTMVIDTPGMRELGMWTSEGGIDNTFYDVESLASKCKFTNCTHNNEPGCAVQEALELGIISKARWNNYIKLKKETEFALKKEKQIIHTREKKSKINKKKNCRRVDERDIYDY